MLGIVAVVYDSLTENILDDMVYVFLVSRQAGWIDLVLFENIVGVE